jgi:phage terminase small subunit
MKKGLIIETRVISEIRRQRELMGLKPVVLNEAAERIPFLNRVIKWIVGNAPETKLSDMLGGNAPQIMKRLQKLGINSIETLEKNLFDEAGTATRKIPTDVEKSIIKAFRKKVFTDPDLADLAKESVVDYFDRLGNLSNGVSVSETIENLLSADFTIPDVRKAADDLIAQLELRFGKDNEAVQYVKKSTEMKKVDNAFDDVDVNGPKVDDANTPEPEPININGSDTPNPDDIKFDFGSNTYPDPEKLPDLEIDFEAAYRAMQFEPEKVPETLANQIRTMADRTPLFKGQSEAKKIEVIEEIKSKFVILYNKEVKDATAQIVGALDDPKVLAQIEKAWKSISTSPSAKQALLDKALKDSKVKLSPLSKQYWKNYATGKSASTGADIGPKQWFKNYAQAVGVSTFITVGQIVLNSITSNKNIGWDNLPGDTDGEKIYELIKPGEAFFKASLPPFMGSLLLTIGVDRLFINKYRKPSANEIREKLLIKNEATVEVKDVPASTYKDAEYSRTILINGINVGDWTLEIETKKLVAMKKGDSIPEDAKTGSTGNTPAPAPAPVVKTTMTKAEVEAKAVSSTHGYVAPIRFTPNEDNKDSYDGIDKDGYKFIAKLVSGEIAITSNGKE